MKRRVDHGRSVLAVVFAVLAMAILLQTTACVETAECNESVTCSSGEVCFEFRCRSICDVDADCADDQSCEPCKPPESEEGRCFGEEESACVPQ
ncbi:MAG: hypothetical protein ACQEVA_16570 [Myxococcota bacterium]